MSLPAIIPVLKSALTITSKIAPAFQAAMAVGSVATNYLAGQAQADAQEENNRQAADRQRQYMIDDLDATTRMGQQEVTAASQKLQQNEVEARKAGATARAGAAAGGVSGFSVEALLSDLYGQEASIRDSVNQNLEATGAQINTERQSTYRGYQERAFSLNQPVSRPSLVGSVFEAGTGIYGAYKDHLRVSRKST